MKTMAVFLLIVIPLAAMAAHSDTDIISVIGPQGCLDRPLTVGNPHPRPYVPQASLYPAFSALLIADAKSGDSLIPNVDGDLDLRDVDWDKIKAGRNGSNNNQDKGPKRASAEPKDDDVEDEKDDEKGDQGGEEGGPDRLWDSCKLG
ncbi:MAG: hypothetical protein HY913_09085 [Desulfomonile tiedjei]|nr:hypothetical protein [Desulfomonile tiedjei]